ncbi:hypothetical protein AAMO2058_000305300 [Amorphochlora amoebiformis]
MSDNDLKTSDDDEVDMEAYAKALADAMGMGSKVDESDSCAVPGRSAAQPSGDDLDSLEITKDSPDPSGSSVDPNPLDDDPLVSSPALLMDTKAFEQTQGIGYDGLVMENSDEDEENEGKPSLSTSGHNPGQDAIVDSEIEIKDDMNHSFAGVSRVKDENTILQEPTEEEGSEVKIAEDRENNEEDEIEIANSYGSFAGVSKVEEGKGAGYSEEEEIEIENSQPDAPHASAGLEKWEHGSGKEHKRSEGDSLELGEKTSSIRVEKRTDAKPEENLKEREGDKEGGEDYTDAFDELSPSGQEHGFAGVSPSGREHGLGSVSPSGQEHGFAGFSPSGQEHGFVGVERGSPKEVEKVKPAERDPTANREHFAESTDSGASGYEDMTSDDGDAGGEYEDNADDRQDSKDSSYYKPQVPRVTTHRRTGHVKSQKKPGKRKPCRRKKKCTGRKSPRKFSKSPRKSPKSPGKFSRSPRRQPKMSPRRNDVWSSRPQHTPPRDLTDREKEAVEYLTRDTRKEAVQRAGKQVRTFSYKPNVTEKSKELVKHTGTWEDRMERYVKSYNAKIEYHRKGTRTDPPRDCTFKPEVTNESLQMTKNRPKFEKRLETTVKTWIDRRAMMERIFEEEQRKRERAFRMAHAELTEKEQGFLARNYFVKKEKPEPHLNFTFKPTLNTQRKLKSKKSFLKRYESDLATRDKKKSKMAQKVHLNSEAKAKIRKLTQDLNQAKSRHRFRECIRIYTELKEVIREAERLSRQAVRARKEKVLEDRKKAKARMARKNVERLLQDLNSQLKDAMNENDFDLCIHLKNQLTQVETGYIKDFKQIKPFQRPPPKPPTRMSFSHITKDCPNVLDRMQEDVEKRRKKKTDILNALKKPPPIRTPRSKRRGRTVSEIARTGQPKIAFAPSPNLSSTQTLPPKAEKLRRNEEKSNEKSPIYNPARYQEEQIPEQNHIGDKPIWEKVERKPNKRGSQKRDSNPLDEALRTIRMPISSPDTSEIENLAKLSDFD